MGGGWGGGKNGPAYSFPLQIQIHKLVLITCISSYSAYFIIIFLVMKLVFQYINVLIKICK